MQSPLSPTTTSLNFHHRKDRKNHICQCHTFHQITNITTKLKHTPTTALTTPSLNRFAAPVKTDVDGEGLVVIEDVLVLETTCTEVPCCDGDPTTEGGGATLVPASLIDAGGGEIDVCNVAGGAGDAGEGTGMGVVVPGGVPPGTLGG